MISSEANDPETNVERQKGAIVGVVNFLLQCCLPFKLDESVLFQRITDTHFARQAVSEAVLRARKELNNEVVHELSTTADVAMICE
jgi:hypothetical protein